MILHWLLHSKDLPAEVTCLCLPASLSRPGRCVSVVQPIKQRDFVEKQSSRPVQAFGQRRGTDLESYLPIVIEASINVGVRDLAQEENLRSERKSICF